MMDVNPLQQQFLRSIEDAEVMEGASWTGLVWQEMPWHGAEVRHCIFERNTFVDINAWSCQFDGVVFVDCRWEASTLKACTFTRCQFVNCTFDSATLDQVQFLVCAFDGCVFVTCSLAESAWANAPRLHLRIAASRAERLLLTGNRQLRLAFNESTFQHLVLADFDFSALQLERVRFQNLIALECKARNIDFGGVHLVQSQFTDSDMAGSIFSQADLSQACFKGCNLQGCRFDRAIMRQTLLLEADASHAIFAGAQLECANLSDAKCERAVFRGADLTMTIFHRSNLQHADFAHCNMSFTDFSYANISHADFRGGHFMRSTHHAVIDHDTRYGSRSGILVADQERLRAEHWVVRS